MGSLSPDSGGALVPSNQEVRVSIYSAMIGDYEEVRACSPDPGRVPFYLFTERASGVNSKDCVNTRPSAAPADARRSSRLAARWHKVQGRTLVSSDVDYVVWVDANIEFVSTVAFWSLIRWCVTENIEVAAFPHPVRANWRQELSAALERGGGTTAEAAHRQKERYYADGYRRLGGLYLTGVLVRKARSERVAAMEQVWWHDLRSYTPRDQVSLPVAAARACVDVHRIPVPYSHTSLASRLLGRSRPGVALGAVARRWGGGANLGPYHQNDLVRVWRH